MAKINFENVVPISAILHIPHGSGGGHLVCALKVGEQWWLNDDTNLSIQISQMKVAQLAVCVALEELGRYE